MGGDELHPQEDKRPQFSQLEGVIHFRWKWYACDIPHVVNELFPLRNLLSYGIALFSSALQRKLYHQSIFFSLNPA